jgi:hypothetical protein
VVAVVLLSMMDPAAPEWRAQPGYQHLVLTAAAVLLETTMQGRLGRTVPTQQVVMSVAPVEDPRQPLVEAPRV